MDDTSTKSDPEFSVVIPWWTDDGPRQEIFDWILHRWASILPEKHIDLAWGKDSPDSSNRAAARNFLADQTKADVIVFADADTIPMAGNVLKAVTAARYGKWAIAYGEDRYYNLSQEKTREYLSLPPSTVVDEPVEGEFEHKVTSWAGMFAIKREDFNQVRYDERFVGWGWEDSAFVSRASDRIGLPDRIDGFVCHLWHPRSDATFDTPAERANRRLFAREYKRDFGALR